MTVGLRQRLERKHREQFEILATRVLAPYARFQRDPETGCYKSIPVAAAWQFWQGGAFSPYRPDLDRVGQEFRDNESKGASRRAGSKRGRPVMTRKAKGRSKR